MKNRFLLYVLLLLSTLSCKSTNKNRYQIKGIDIIAYGVNEINDTLYLSHYDSTSSDKVLLLLQMNKDFITDGSDSSNVQFEGIHGNIDEFSYLETSGYIEMISSEQTLVASFLPTKYLNSIINIYNKSGKNIIDSYYSLDSIPSLYNNMMRKRPEYYGNNFLTYPILTIRSDSLFEEKITYYKKQGEKLACNIEKGVLLKE